MNYSLLLLSVLFIALVIAGCGAPSAKETPPDQDRTQHDAQDMHADQGHAAHDDPGAVATSDMDKMKAELAKLSAEDADSAMKQHFCPVSGEMLGVMGPPINVDVNGTQVWICCESCRDQLLSDPERFLAKLKN